jgi:hypothetical protein
MDFVLSTCYKVAMVGAVLVVVVPVVIVWAWSLHMPGDYGLRVFARRFGVTLDEATRPFLARRIRRSRCWRALGGALGWVIATLPLTVSQFRPGLGGQLNQPFLSVVPYAGYLLGNVIVELVLAARANDRPRRALLRFRRVTDYVPSWPITTTRAAAIVGVCLTPVAWRLTEPSGRAAWSGGRILTDLTVMIAGLAFMELALHFIAHRRQVATTPETLVADEALRADSARRVAGASMVVVTSSACSQLDVAAKALDPWLTLVALALYLLVLGAWPYLIDSNWRLPPTPAP